MKRQDDFLRWLQRLAHSHREGNSQDKGLALIIDEIEARLPHLKPVAYENHDLSSGLSGAGIHHICGDKDSIHRVRQLLNCEQYVQLYRELLEDHTQTSHQWRLQFDAMQQRAMKAEAALEQIRDQKSDARAC